MPSKMFGTLAMLWMCVFYTAVVSGDTEPLCLSRYDYDYKLMTSIVSLEQQQKDIMQTVDKQGQTILQQEQTLRQHEETVQQQMVNMRLQEENVRQQEETVRQQEETMRQYKETVRQQGETVLQQEETMRQYEETVRQQGETVRHQEETMRQYEETVRQQEETMRQYEETVRQQGETVRQQEETMRQYEETVRHQEETMRQYEETVRQQEETVRHQEETMRQYEETVRQQGETVRQQEETMRQYEETLRKQEETIEKLQTSQEENARALEEHVKRPVARSGSTYVRWGRTTCPDNGTELVYTGYAGGSYHTHQGAAANTLCLPNDPLWGDFDDSLLNYAPVFGAEYQIFGSYSQKLFKKDLGNHDAPCAVCRSVRSTAVMIPARNACYPGWTMEYIGYLTAGYISHRATEFVCLDNDPDLVPDSKSSMDGKLFYVAEAYCSSLKCPPYVNGRELTCVVCTQ